MGSRQRGRAAQIDRELRSRLAVGFVLLLPRSCILALVLPIPLFANDL